MTAQMGRPSTAASVNAEQRIAGNEVAGVVGAVDRAAVVRLILRRPSQTLRLDEEQSWVERHQRLQTGAGDREQGDREQGLVRVDVQPDIHRRLLGLRVHPGAPPPAVVAEAPVEGERPLGGGGA